MLPLSVEEATSSSMAVATASLAHPALFEAEPEGGFTVTFPETGIAATYGAISEAALAQAEDIAGGGGARNVVNGEDVPWPVPVPKADRLRPPLSACQR
jgi:hypothetical protein